MGALRAAASGIRRALARLSRRPAAPVAEKPAHPSPEDLEASISAVEAMRLGAFRDTLSRFTWPELAQLAEVAERSEILPGADAAISERFADRVGELATAAELATLAAVRRAGAELDTARTLAALTARNLTDAVAQHVAEVYARPVSPRAPAPARLA